MYHGWTKDEPITRPATIQQMRESMNTMLRLGWNEAAQALENAIELTEIAYRDEKRIEVSDEPTKDELTAIFPDGLGDEPRARFTFPELCRAMDEYEATGRAEPDWMLRAYRDMQTLPAPIAVNVPSFVGVVYHV